MIKNLRKHWKLIAVVAAITAILAIAFVPSIFPRAAVTYYVDNTAATGGNGSLERPWNDVAGHVSDLQPGDTMLIRGNPALPARPYVEDTINLVGCNSGTPSSPIVVRPYQDEYVEIASIASGHGINVSGVDYWTFQDLHMDASNPTYMINILGDHNVIENCTLYDGEWGIRIYSGNHNTVRGCTIHNFDSGRYKDAHGVYLMKNTHDTVVEGNTIYDIRGDCIQLGKGGALSGTLIENNHLYTTLGRCSENAIDIKGGSPTIRGNVFHGFRYCDGGCGGTGGGTGEAIVVQTDAIKILIHDNEFYDCASGVRTQTGDITITNNLFHDLIVDDTTWLNSAIALVGSDATYVDYNTFVRLPRHYLFIHTNSIDTVFTNNLLYDVNRNEIRSPALAHHNGWFRATHLIPGDHDITGDDPLLTANYRLTADSPARGAGQGGTDLGAFPYSEGTPQPTPTTISPLPTPTTISPLPTPTPRPTLSPAPTGCPPDPPTRTPWPVQPTYTPRPTYTPWPTSTSVCPPTATLAPNPSPTPYPTATYYPTSTPYPSWSGR